MLVCRNQRDELVHCFPHVGPVCNGWKSRIVGRGSGLYEVHFFDQVFGAPCCNSRKMFPSRISVHVTAERLIGSPRNVQRQGLGGKGTRQFPVAGRTDAKASKVLCGKVSFWCDGPVGVFHESLVVCKERVEIFSPGGLVTEPVPGVVFFPLGCTNELHLKGAGLLDRPADRALSPRLPNLLLFGLAHFRKTSRMGTGEHLHKRRIPFGARTG